MRPNLPLALAGAALGYLLPSMALGRMAKRRQHRIRLSLPDALDLLVVSVEAGLGLDQAIQRVGEELAFAHPDLSDELRLINLELRAGKARAEALHNLADRTGVDDIASLVAMLVQTDKFGTSVAQSLRVHSETLRTKRRQRAEEAAAKTGVKMVFPLVFCIFPAIWVVTIGPAAIKFVQVLIPMAEEMTQWPPRRSTPPTPSLVPPPADDARRHRPPADQVEQLLVKTLYAGELTGLALADRMRLPYAILEPLIERLRAEQLIEVRGAAGTGSAGYRYALTDNGRDRARQYIEVNQYAGAGARAAGRLRGHDERAAGGARPPGPRADAQRLLASHHQRADARAARAGGQRRQGDVPLRPARQRQDRDRRRAWARTIGGDMYVPYAIDVDGQIITMYDPINHERLDDRRQHRRA